MASSFSQMRLHLLERVGRALHPFLEVGDIVPCVAEILLQRLLQLRAAPRDYEPIPRGQRGPLHRSPEAPPLWAESSGDPTLFPPKPPDRCPFRALHDLDRHATTLLGRTEKMDEARPRRSRRYRLSPSSESLTSMSRGWRGAPQEQAGPPGRGRE